LNASWSIGAGIACGRAFDGGDHACTDPRVEVTQIASSGRRVADPPGRFPHPLGNSRLICSWDHGGTRGQLVASLLDGGLLPGRDLLVLQRCVVQAAAQRVLSRVKQTKRLGGFGLRQAAHALKQPLLRGHKPTGSREAKIDRADVFAGGFWG
jgi:hypothetical protein